jgi:hypothetical protein
MNDHPDGSPEPSEVGMCSALGALTADDWEAARRSLGRGSWSLLTGTSTRELDVIVENYATAAEPTDTDCYPSRIEAS